SGGGAGRIFRTCGAVGHDSLAGGASAAARGSAVCGAGIIACPRGRSQAVPHQRRTILLPLQEVTAVARRPRNGQVLVYYGQGKGKTTAALGLALRAIGRGWRVCMLQFTKSGEWPPGEPVGETAAAARLAPELELIPTGIGFVNILGDPYPFEAHKEAAEKGLALAREKLASNDYDLVILDEVL